MIVMTGHTSDDGVRGTPGAARALEHRGAHDLFEVPQRVERMDVHAVGDLAGHAARPRSHGSDVDRDVGMLDRARAPHRRQQVERPVVAVEVELLLALERAEDRAQSEHVLAEPGSRMIELHRVPTLVVRLHLRPEPEHEVPSRGVGELPRDLGGDHRTAHERERDRGADVEPGRG